MKRNPALKLAAISLGGILILWLIYTILFGTGSGIAINFGGNFIGRHYEGGVYMGNGFVYGGAITSLFVILIKILFVVFIIGLVGGILVWIKNYVFTEEDKETIKNAFTGKGNVAKKEKCSVCGKDLNAEWKACPHCGTVRNQIGIEDKAENKVENKAENKSEKK